MTGDYDCLIPEHVEAAANCKLKFVYLHGVGFYLFLECLGLKAGVSRLL